jgi:hypothetical protein
MKIKKPVYLLLAVLIFGTKPFLLAQSDYSVPLTWPNGKKAAISLSFDDARTSHVNVGLELFRKLDTKVTFYVNPGPVKQSLTKWKEIVLDGHEIGNHTILHPCSGNFTWARDKALESYSLASMRQELISANHQIEELLAVTPRSFAYTCGQAFVGRGSETRSYVPLVAELFGSGRGWLNEAPNDPHFVDLAQVQGIEMDGKDFEQDIKPLIDAAIENGDWLVLAGHEIGTEGNQTTKVAMLEKLAAYVHGLEDQIWSAPVGDVARYIQAYRDVTDKALARHLSFHASFDRGTTADYARGEAKLFTGKAYDKLEKP